MNRQREIIVTVTYNDLGIIVDAKAEPRKMGRWTGVGYYDEDCKHHLWYACDKCGYQTTWHMKPIFNYCPNCGADMRQVGGDAE